MTFSKEIARFRPTRDITKLGRPDRLFCGSAKNAAVIKYIMLSIGMACLAGTIGTIIAFFVFAPPAIRSDDTLLGLLAVGAALLLAISALSVCGASRVYWLWKPSCYLIYPDGMAFTQGRGWTMLAWEDVLVFRSLTIRAQPYLLMKDGSKVEVHETASYIDELYEMIEDRLLETRASHGIAFAPPDELTDVEPYRKEEPESPVGIIVTGMLLVIAAAWFYLHLRALEDASGALHWLAMSTSMIGGKVVAAGLVLLTGLGLITKGFLQLAKGQRVRRKSAHVLWEARYRPNN